MARVRHVRSGQHVGGHLHVTETLAIGSAVYDLSHCRVAAACEQRVETLWLGHRSRSRSRSRSRRLVRRLVALGVDAKDAEVYGVVLGSLQFENEVGGGGNGDAELRVVEERVRKIGTTA